MTKHHAPIRFYLALFALIFMIACKGQEPTNSTKPPTNQALDFNILHNTNPQIGEYVVEVYEDKKGNLWLGTIEKGAARYDGKKLTYFSTASGLCGKTISSFAEDKEGNLWFGSHTGVSKYDGTTFTTVQASEGLHNSDWGWMGVKADQSGTIWISCKKGLFRYIDGEMVAFELPIDKAKILDYSITPGRASLDFEDSKGNLWFGTDGFGALKYDGKTFTHFSKEDGLSSNTVNDIMEDKLGNIWFICMQAYQPRATGDGGLCRYDGKVFTTFLDQEGLNNNDLYTIYRDKSDAIWIGATGVGVYRYDGENFTLYNTTDRMDLTERFGLQSALEDKNGKLWFGFSGGLFRFEDGQIINITQNGPW